VEEPDKLVLWTKLMMYTNSEFVVSVTDYKCHKGGQMKDGSYHKLGFRVPLEKHTEEEIAELMEDLRQMQENEEERARLLVEWQEGERESAYVGGESDTLGDMSEDEYYEMQQREWEEEMRLQQQHNEAIEEWKSQNEAMVKEITEKAEYEARKYYKDEADVNARKRAFGNCTLPYGSNKRFICGWVYSKEEEEKEFVMVFWNSFSGIPNGHSDLQQLYEVNGARLQNISGGFFINENHNDYTSKTVYLFGKSQTYSGFERDIPDILKYGEKHGITFVCRPEMKGIADLM
jgi:hypothetical protein